MEPSQGKVTGDLRVLVTRMGEPQMTNLGSVVGEFLGGWKVTVSTSDTSEVIAEQVVSGRHPAERLRDEFIRVATLESLDRTDPERINRLLRD